MEYITALAESEAGAAFIALLMASSAATIANIFIVNEGDDAPAWKRYGGMFLRALSGSVGENRTKKSQE